MMLTKLCHCLVFIIAFNSIYALTVELFWRTSPPINNSCRLEDRIWRQSRHFFACFQLQVNCTAGKQNRGPWLPPAYQMGWRRSTWREIFDHLHIRSPKTWYCSVLPYLRFTLVWSVINQLYSHANEGWPVETTPRRGFETFSNELVHQRRTRLLLPRTIWRASAKVTGRLQEHIHGRGCAGKNHFSLKQQWNHSFFKVSCERDELASHQWPKAWSSVCWSSRHCHRNPSDAALGHEQNGTKLKGTDVLHGP